MTNFRIQLVLIPAAIASKMKWFDWSYWVEILVGATLLIGISSCLGGGYYLGKWMGIGAGLILVLGIAIAKRYGLAAASLVGYLCMSSLWVMSSAQSRYMTLNAYDQMGIKYYAAESLGKLLLVLAPMLIARNSQINIRGVGRALCCAFVVISLFQIEWEWYWQGCATVNSCGGALKNPSLNAAMMAVCLPFLTACGPAGWVFVALVAWSSMLGKTAIGLGITALYVGMEIWARLPGRHKAPVTALVLGAFTLAGYITHGQKPFFNSSGRFEMWQFFMKVWAMNWRNIPFGTGFGTFGVFSINLQKAFSISADSWWVWMHNDWLQMAFECGLLGLALVVWVYLSAIKKLYVQRYIPEFQSLALFGVMMGSEYGLHVAPACLYAAWIGCVALVKPE